MDTAKIVKSMDEYVQSLKKQLNEHDGSGMALIAAKAASGLDSLKSAVMDNEKARNALSNVKTHAEKLEQAVKKGDRQMSTKLLTLMEDALRDLKSREPENKTKDPRNGKQ